MCFRKIVSCLCLASLFLAYCSPAVRLTPSPKADIPSGSPDAAFGETAGVHVLVETESWTGYPSIEEHVTPIRVTITNRSDTPLRIRYQSFVLKVNSDHLRAQAPYRVQGMMRIPYSEAKHFDDTVFHYDDLEVDPCCEILERVLAQSDTSSGDEGLPDVWVQLPTREMVQLVLPDGVVDTGELVSGFLYFDRLRSGPAEVTFTADIVSAVDG
ncbi:MAG: hypothetical protein ACOC36_04045, partial [Fibrobacterota bacterium]